MQGHLPVFTEVIDLPQLQQRGLALRAECAVIQVANVVGVTDLAVINVGTPVLAVVALMLYAHSPALAVALGKVFAVFVIVAHVLARDIPSAGILGEPTAVSLV